MAKIKASDGEQLQFDLSAPEQSKSTDERNRELTLLAEQVAECTACAELVRSRSKTVFGVGNTTPEICFVGEGPGAEEDAQGEPFVGAAGQMLNRIISAMAMRREEVYVCNVVKCRPPGNRVPTAEEATNCRDFLTRQLRLIAPKVIVTLGTCAAQNLLRTKSSLSKLRGGTHQCEGVPVICTYHPAFLLPSRSPERKPDVWEDVKRVLRLLEKPIPGEE